MERSRVVPRGRRAKSREEFKKVPTVGVEKGKGGAVCGMAGMY